MTAKLGNYFEKSKFFNILFTFFILPTLATRSPEGIYKFFTLYFDLLLT